MNFRLSAVVTRPLSVRHSHVRFLLNNKGSLRVESRVHVCPFGKSHQCYIIQHLGVFLYHFVFCGKTISVNNQKIFAKLSNHVIEFKPESKRVTP